LKKWLKNQCPASCLLKDKEQDLEEKPVTIRMKGKRSAPGNSYPE
jgi:hypothetical protein